MANEKEIRVSYPISGLGNVTAAIYKPDNTIRDIQTAVALTDLGHPTLYSNDAVSITIEAGDTIQPAVAGQTYGAGEEYIPAVTVFNIAEIVAAILSANGFTDGGTLTVSELYKILAAWTAGDLIDKIGEDKVYQVKDADNDTVVMETTLDPAGPRYKQVVIL